MTPDGPLTLPPHVAGDARRAREREVGRKMITQHWAWGNLQRKSPLIDHSYSPLQAGGAEQS